MLKQLSLAYKKILYNRIFIIFKNICFCAFIFMRFIPVINIILALFYVSYYIVMFVLDNNYTIKAYEREGENKNKLLGLRFFVLVKDFETIKLLSVGSLCSRLLWSVVVLRHLIDLDFLIEHYVTFFNYIVKLFF